MTDQLQLLFNAGYLPICGDCQLVLFCVASAMTEIRQCVRCRSLALLTDAGANIKKMDVVVGLEHMGFICPCAAQVEGRHRFNDGTQCARGINV